MCIDIGTETPLSLTEAAKFAPGRPHLATVWRWCQRGVRGIKLETIVVGGRRFTTVEALERFITRTTAAANREPASVRTPRQRQRAIEAAEAALARDGI
ncbi:MAG TPA: DUF1580 domain-containing protein [Pirellulales bacterium]|nr:DUF1580 domain-containing protein [Pirellulales bacterium]